MHNILESAVSIPLWRDRSAALARRLVLVFGLIFATWPLHAEEVSPAELATQIEGDVGQASSMRACRTSTEHAVALSPDRRVVGADIIGAVPGFARAAGTVGGLGHRLLVVSNTADYDPKGRAIPGSLRATLEAAKRAGGGWIAFDTSLGRGARIDLLLGLTIPSNVTLDGGCSGITITGPVDESILNIPTKNVIITRLAFEKRGPIVAKDDGDCISVLTDYDAVYIAYNNFGQCGDGQIDVTAPRPKGVPRRVTIAFNWFFNHNASMLVDAVDCEPSEKPCSDPLTLNAAEPELFVTLHGNLFFRTAQRHPRIAGRAFVHATNNVIAFENFRTAQGHLGSAYGIFVGIGGRLLAEDNLIFLIRNQTNNRPLAIWTSSSPGALRMPDPPGAAIARHTLAPRTTRDETVVDPGRMELVPAPSYVIDQTIDFAALGARTAARCIVQHSGIYGSTAWDAACNPRPN